MDEELPTLINPPNESVRGGGLEEACLTLRSSILPASPDFILGSGGRAFPAYVDIAV